MMATISDLMRLEGRAELVRGEIRRLSLLRYGEAIAVGNIRFALHRVEGPLRGEVYGTTLVYALPTQPSGRQTISPVVSWFAGPWPEDRMGPIIGAPRFAGELSDEPELDARRADYFRAGTLVLWEIDVRAATVRVWRNGEAEPRTFVGGQVIDAEPAIPGWTMSVDEVFSDGP